MTKRVEDLEAVIHGAKMEVGVNGEKIQQLLVKQEVSEGVIDDKLKDIRETVDKLAVAEVVLSEKTEALQVSLGSWTAE